MDDTIERNIALSRPDAQFEEIVEAAKAARCDEFIKAPAEAIRQKLEKVERDSLEARDNVSQLLAQF